MGMLIPIGNMLLPVWLCVIALTWLMVWKGMALWASAKGKQMVWFIVLFVVNTLGILEIVYLCFFQPNPWVKGKGKAKKARKK